MVSPVATDISDMLHQWLASGDALVGRTILQSLFREKQKSRRQVVISNIMSAGCRVIGKLWGPQQVVWCLGIANIANTVWGLATVVAYIVQLCMLAWFYVGMNMTLQHAKCLQPFASRFRVHSIICTVSINGRSAPNHSSVTMKIFIHHKIVENNKQNGR